MKRAKNKIRRVLERAFAAVEEELWEERYNQEEGLDALVAALEEAGFPAWRGSSLAQVYGLDPEPHPHILVLTEEGPLYVVWDDFEMNIYRIMRLKELVRKATDGRGDILLEEHARALRKAEEMGLDATPYWGEWREAERILGEKGLIPSTWTLPGARPR